MNLPTGTIKVNCEDIPLSAEVKEQVPEPYYAHLPVMGNTLPNLETNAAHLAHQESLKNRLSKNPSVLEEKIKTTRKSFNLKSILILKNQSSADEASLEVLDAFLAIVENANTFLKSSGQVYSTTAYAQDGGILGSQEMFVGQKVGLFESGSGIGWKNVRDRLQKLKLSEIVGSLY